MVRIVSPYITEVPSVIETGTAEEMLRSAEAFGDATTRYDDVMIMGVGGKALLVHGELYLDVFRTPELLRLFGIRQLGILSNEHIFIGADHKKYSHSLGVALRTEMALRANSASEKHVRLGIVSAALHDAAMPPLSEQGKLGARDVLDEEMNVADLVGRPEMAKLLRKYEVKGDDVVACVRGQYPGIGPLLNSRGLDLDQMAYTTDDSTVVCVNEPERRRMKLYERDPSVQGLHWRVVMHDSYPLFLDPEAVIEMLWMRAWLFRDVYQGPFQRGREAFMEVAMRRLWNEGVLDRETLLEMDDDDLIDLVKSETDGALGDALFSHESMFEEVARCYDEAEEPVRRRYGDGFVVKRWNPFQPGTGTMVSHNSRDVPVSMVFPEDAREIEAIGRRHGYVGVYRLAGESRSTMLSL